MEDRAQIEVAERPHDAPADGFASVELGANPGGAALQHLHTHVLRPEDDVVEVVLGPVALEDPAGMLHLVVKRSTRKRSKDVCRGEIEFDPIEKLKGPSKDRRRVVVHAEHDPGEDGDTSVVELLHYPRIGPRAVEALAPGI